MDEILYIGITQSFFAGLMIATKKPQQISDRILAAWLFLICFEMIIIVIDKNITEISAFTVIPFTYGPLLYYYIKFISIESYKFKHSFWIHFIPFVIFFILSVIYRDKPVITLHKFFKPDTYITLRMMYSSSFFISITTYSIAVIVHIFKHQKNIKNLFSYTSGKYTLNWLKTVIICFYATYLLMFTSGGAAIWSNKFSIDPVFLSHFGLTFFAFAFSFYGFKQPGIFTEIEQKSVKSKSKYQRSGLKNKDIDKYLEKIIDYVTKDKAFLNGDLTIQDVSEQTNIPRYYITQILNERLKRNFYTFINEYRIEEVNKRIVKKTYDKLTIIAIAYDCGFNSKSSFHTAFKTITGLTPSQYKKQNLI